MGRYADRLVKCFISKRDEAIATSDHRGRHQLTADVLERGKSKSAL